MRPMMLHALSKVTSGSATAVEASDVDAVPAATPQAAGRGVSTGGALTARLGT